MYKPKKHKLNDMELRIKNTILPTIDYTKHKVVSYSQYSIYATCPHRWALKHIEKKYSIIIIDNSTNYNF